jgi:hypothetical protein
MQLGQMLAQFTGHWPDRSAVAVCVALVSAFGAAPVAEAAPPLHVQSEGTCPNAEQVSAALSYLLKESGDTT